MGADNPTATTTVPESAAVLSTHSAPTRPAAAPGRVQILLCLSAFLAALNFFAPTPFYPQMAHDLQTTVPLLGQVVTLMALISAGLGLLAGPLADRYGYRWPLVIGLLAIAVGLLGTGLAPTYPVLLGLGVVMGLGDALAYSLPFAIAATYFSGSCPAASDCLDDRSIEHRPDHRRSPAHRRGRAYQLARGPGGSWGRGPGGCLVRRGCPACGSAASCEPPSRKGAACGLFAVVAPPAESALPRGVRVAGNVVGRTADLHGCASS